MRTAERSAERFAFLAPATLTAAHLVAVALTVGIAWPPELWVGSPLLAGAGPAR